MPDRVGLVGYLGTIAARRGDRAAALRLDRELQEVRAPYMFGRQVYWRARIHALLGERDHAVDLLRDAFSRGFPYTPSLHADLAFAALRDFPPFQELIKPKG